MASCSERLYQPQPRVALGLALRGVASSAIDISDGLLADLGHILERSRVGAEVLFAALPPLRFGGAFSANENEIVRRCIRAGGDDYELCFTAPEPCRANIERISAALVLPLARIGKIVVGRGCIVRAADGSAMQIEEQGYDHFA